jgi:hypothetical protein
MDLHLTLCIGTNGSEHVHHRNKKTMEVRVGSFEFYFETCALGGEVVKYEAASTCL